MTENIENKIRSFFQEFRLIKFKRGEVILRADDFPTGVNYISDGFVRKYAMSSGGDELTLQILEPGSYFPIAWTINEETEGYYYEALTSVSVYRASKNDWQKFIEDYPEVLSDVNVRISSGWRDLLLKFENVVFGNANSRVIDTLLYLARHFGKRSNGGVVIDYWFTHQDIAAMSGISREQVSREMGELIKSGHVEYKDRFIAIKDKKMLHSLLPSAQRN